MRREMRALLRRSHQLIYDCRAASISFAPATTASPSIVNDAARSFAAAGTDL
jgi:hypothetical protein